MGQIQVFTCGRGILVVFHGGILKTRKQYVSAFRDGTYSVISDQKAQNWFQRLKMTLSYRSHASSDYFGSVSVDDELLRKVS